MEKSTGLAFKNMRKVYYQNKTDKEVDFLQMMERRKQIKLIDELRDKISGLYVESTLLKLKGMSDKEVRLFLNNVIRESESQEIEPSLNPEQQRVEREEYNKHFRELIKSIYEKHQLNSIAE